MPIVPISNTFCIGESRPRWCGLHAFWSGHVSLFRGQEKQNCFQPSISIALYLSKHVGHMKKINLFLLKCLQVRSWCRKKITISVFVVPALLFVNFLHTHEHKKTPLCLLQHILSIRQLSFSQSGLITLLGNRKVTIVNPLAYFFHFFYVMSCRPSRNFGMAYFFQR